MDIQQPFAALLPRASPYSRLERAELESAFDSFREDSGNLSFDGTTNIFTALNIAGNGSRLTNLNVSNASDGTLTVTGASSETLGGKKLVGSIDGVVIKISKTNTILSVVRSSAPKAERNWGSATSALLLGGSVVTGVKTESAVTKFSNSYAPTWTYRFASTGPTLTLGSTYAFFVSKGAIPQLNNWEPKSPQALLLTFDTKGLISGAFSAGINQREIVGLSSSKELGVVCLTASAEAISIFTLG